MSRREKKRKVHHENEEAAASKERQEAGRLILHLLQENKRDVKELEKEGICLTCFQSTSWDGNFCRCKYKNREEIKAYMELFLIRDVVNLFMIYASPVVVECMSDGMSVHTNHSTWFRNTFQLDFCAMGGKARNEDKMLCQKLLMLHRPFFEFTSTPEYFVANGPGQRCFAMIRVEESTSTKCDVFYGLSPEEMHFQMEFEMPWIDEYPTQDCVYFSMLDGKCVVLCMSRSGDFLVVRQSETVGEVKESFFSASKWQLMKLGDGRHRRDFALGLNHIYVSWEDQSTFCDEEEEGECDGECDNVNMIKTIQIPWPASECDEVDVKFINRYSIESETGNQHDVLKRMLEYVHSPYGWCEDYKCKYAALKYIELHGFCAGCFRSHTSCQGWYKDQRFAWKLGLEYEKVRSGPLHFWVESDSKRWCMFYVQKQRGRKVFMSERGLGTHCSGSLTSCNYMRDDPGFFFKAIQHMQFKAEHGKDVIIISVTLNGYGQRPMGVVLRCVKNKNK